MQKITNNSVGIISVKEAKKLLGKSHECLSDDEVEAMIVEMTELASFLLDWQNSSTKQHGEVLSYGYEYYHSSTKKCGHLH